MKKFRNANEVLDFAMAREAEAHDFYLHWSNRVGSVKMHKVMEDFALDEAQHRARLEAIKAGQLGVEEDEVGDLEIADELEQVKPSREMSYKDALVLAIRREDQTERLYVSLADKTRRKQVREMFLKLAQEEKEHRLRFESEYDMVSL